jgi:hypothetical protein
MRTLTILLGAATGVAAIISVGAGVAAAARDVVVALNSAASPEGRQALIAQKAG